LQQILHLKAQIAKAVSLKPNEIHAGARGDAIWKFGDNLLSIMSKDEAPEIGDLADLIFGGDAQKHLGDFFQEPPSTLSRPLAWLAATRLVRRNKAPLPHITLRLAGIRAGFAG
jgi:hypothetical protein